MNAYMHLSVLENQLFSSIFTDSIFILSKLRKNIVDFQGIITDYHYKMLFFPYSKGYYSVTGLTFLPQFV